MIKEAILDLIEGKFKIFIFKMLPKRKTSNKS